VFSIVSIIILLSTILVLYRLIKGPVVFDRVLAANVIGTKAVVLLALIGFIYERPNFLDLALVYALTNFIATTAFLKYHEFGRLD